MASSAPREKSSLSNYAAARTTHIDAELSVDFAASTVSGRVVYSVDLLDKAASEVVLDTKDLTISAVEVDGASAPFTLAERVEPFGCALHVPIDPSTFAGKISVTYSTTPASSALQWLTPAQTAGKAHPYLFSQCQAIHARTMIPCQDTPMVKATYAARVTVPDNLTCLMSALAVGADGAPSTTIAPTPTPAAADRPGQHTFSYAQPVPIPSYLIAIVVGDLAFRDVGPRSRVWAEPSVVEAAAWEFGETEDFIKAGEALLGPYLWGRYDILALCPSFPFGGMENACLTFVTPTLIAGDRSLADVVAHEIAHSWTGNLVTNATWEHFWLNEGFTMMVERKIIAAMQGDAAAEFDAFSGAFALTESIKTFMDRGEVEFTKLVPALDGIDPDDAFSSVPYEKGHYLLYHLQSLVGRVPFEAFLHDYIQTFRYKSITSDDFKAFFTAYFAEGRHALPRVGHTGPIAHSGATTGPVDSLADIALLAVPNTGSVGVPAVVGVSADALAAAARDHAIDTSSVDWQAWFFAAGQPPVQNKYDASERGRVDALADEWVFSTPSAAARSKEATAAWRPAQWIAFLERLVDVSNKLAARSPPAAISPRVLAQIDAVHSLSGSRNSEIKLQWYTLSLRSGIEAVVPDVCTMLTSQGRMKYTRPLYRELVRTSFGRPVAVALFEANKGIYHPICAKMVGVDLEKEGAKPAVTPSTLVAVGAEEVATESGAASSSAGAAAAASAAAASAAVGAEGEEGEEEGGDEDDEDDGEEEDEDEEEEAESKPRRRKGFGLSVAKAKKKNQKTADRIMEARMREMLGMGGAAGGGRPAREEDEDEDEGGIIELDDDEAGGPIIEDMPSRTGAGRASALSPVRGGGAQQQASSPSRAPPTGEKLRAAEEKRAQMIAGSPLKKGNRGGVAPLTETIKVVDVGGSSGGLLSGIGSAVSESLASVEVEVETASIASTVIAAAAVAAVAIGAIYFLRGRK